MSNNFVVDGVEVDGWDISLDSSSAGGTLFDFTQIVGYTKSGTLIAISQTVSLYDTASGTLISIEQNTKAYKTGGTLISISQYVH